MNKVVIVGAGIVGAGIARDLALRGVDVTVIEKDAPASSATGRCHGLLHSGARYAVSDPSAAAECARENPILKAIAPSCIEDTGGLFIATDDREAEFGDRLIASCKRAGVPAEDVSPGISPNADATRCIRTNDARVDPFLLTLSNLYDARLNGAEIIIGKEVKRVNHGSVILDDGSTVKAEVVVIAAGHRCGALLSASDKPAPAISPDKGTILVTERRVCDVIVNRMRPPSSGDIIVPCHTTSLIGTTSSSSSSTIPARDEYIALMKEAIKLLPSVKDARIIRAFSGVRPLLGAGGRDATRDHRIFEDNGIITIAGGKLTTYRLIAEKTSDVVMKALGEHGECKTETLLPDVLREPVDNSMDVLCYCERARQRIIDMDFMKGVDISRFNRLGFGACQGMRCSRNAPDVRTFLEERWKGVRPVLDEGQLQQAYLTWAAQKSRMDF